MLVYDNLEQARMRLSGSTLTYKGKAAYVRGVKDATKTRGMLVDITLYPMYDDNGEELAKTVKLSVPIDDPDLNFRYFKVGYFNDPNSKSSMFFARATTRQQIQGLQPRQLYSTKGGRLPQWQGLTTAFENMLAGNYPTTKEAGRLILEEGWTSVGISRQLAIARDPKLKRLFLLLYRDIPVGLALGVFFDNFQLEEEFAYLKEVLEAEGVPFTMETKQNARD